MHTDSHIHSSVLSGRYQYTTCSLPFCHWHTHTHTDTHTHTLAYIHARCKHPHASNPGTCVGYFNSVSKQVCCDLYQRDCAESTLLRTLPPNKLTKCCFSLQGLTSRFLSFLFRINTVILPMIQ